MSKALLLIDIQNDYFPGGKSELANTDKALERATTVLDAFRDKNLPVIHIRHINLNPGAAFFLPNTAGAEIHPLLTPAAGETIITKHFPNSFCNTNLAEIIKEKGITELVICGMMTHMCIDTTVRAAKDHNIPVTLIKDACATKDLVYDGETISAEQVSSVFFASLNQMFAFIISAEELIV